MRRETIAVLALVLPLGGAIAALQPFPLGYAMTSPPELQDSHLFGDQKQCRAHLENATQTT